ncbi:MAG: DUF5686 family protein, partial [Cytophagales bacterium]
IKLGINFKIKQIYNPIEDKAWLPVINKFVISGKVFGFDFEGEYFAVIKDYKIKLNPDLAVAEMKMVDEKLEKEQAKQIEKKFSKKDQQLQERLASGKEVTNKELRQIIRDYEKQEQQETKEPEVLSESSFKIDSTAYKKDSTFWADIRPVALSKQEERGYEISDSIAIAQKKRDEGDTLKSRKGAKKGFQPLDLLVGDTYTLDKTSSFRIHFPYGGFNTVEGFNLVYRTSFYKRWTAKDPMDTTKRKTSRLEISPIARYAFAREKLTGKLRVEFRDSKRRITVEGGTYVQQYNPKEPIHSFVNTATSLLLGENWMKIYEQNFVDLKYSQQFNQKYTLRGQINWAKRYELTNNSDYTFFGGNKEKYTPNAPVNDGVPTSFPTNTAFITSVSIEARPWQKFRIRNGFKYRVENSSPTLMMEYRKGWDGLLGSGVNFDLLELGIRQQVKFGIRGTLDVAVKGGKFLNNERMFFTDYQHFLGNRTPIITTDPIGSFRLADYYAYSTRDQYLSINAHYHLRKFLITRIAKVRLMGVQENFFVNYLATPSSRNYTEVGYGLDGILRIFRLEGAVSFQNGQYLDYGFRIGISSNLSVNFGD